MRRCYRSAALVLGGILFASSPLSNSCGLITLDVYAAEAAPTVKTRVVNNRVQTAGIHKGEENVETQIPADEPVNIFPVFQVEKNDKSFELEYNEYDILLKIVEAEAGGEDITGKMLVANVIMNRVNSDDFPDTVTEVVYQKCNGSVQFSPTVDGRLEKVTVSEETVEAVDRVMSGEDSSNGALFFRSVYSKGKWHDRALTRILQHGNHIFYTI